MHPGPHVCAYCWAMRCPSQATRQERGDPSMMIAKAQWRRLRWPRHAGKCTEVLVVSFCIPVSRAMGARDGVRWLGPSHSRAETTIGEMAVSGTFTGQQHPRATEAGVSPASSSRRSKSRTSLFGRSSFWCFREGDQVAGCINEFGAERPYRERAALEVSLRKAQKQAIAPPVAEQAEQTAMFIERAKKRLTNAEEWVHRSVPKS